MPIDKPENHKDKTPNKLLGSYSNSIAEEIKDGGEGKVKREHLKDNKKQSNKPHVVHVTKIPKITISEDIEANNIAQRANLISIFTGVVNFFLFCCTVYLVSISYEQANSADNSAKIAKETFKADTAYNNINIKHQKQADKSSDSVYRVRSKRDKELFDLQKRTYISNDSDMKERFKRDTQALNLQIATLKQNNDQFVKQNEPYLKVTIDSIYSRFNMLYFAYSISNLTNTPVRIIGEKSDTQVLDSNPMVNRTLADVFNGVIYVTKETPQPKYMTLHDVSNTLIDRANSGQCIIYWKAQFEYENQITGEKRLYKITVNMQKIRGVNPPYQAFAQNDNIKE